MINDELPPEERRQIKKGGLKTALTATANISVFGPLSADGGVNKPGTRLTE